MVALVAAKLISEVKPEHPVKSSLQAMALPEGQPLPAYAASFVSYAALLQVETTALPVKSDVQSNQMSLSTADDPKS